MNEKRFPDWVLGVLSVADKLLNKSNENLEKINSNEQNVDKTQIISKEQNEIITQNIIEAIKKRRKIKEKIRERIKMKASLSDKKNILISSNRRNMLKDMLRRFKILSTIRSVKASLTPEEKRIMLKNRMLRDNKIEANNLQKRVDKIYKEIIKRKLKAKLLKKNLLGKDKEEIDVSKKEIEEVEIEKLGKPEEKVDIQYKEYKKTPPEIEETVTLEKKEIEKLEKLLLELQDINNETNRLNLELKTKIDEIHKIYTERLSEKKELQKKLLDKLYDFGKKLNLINKSVEVTDKISYGILQRLKGGEKVFSEEEKLEIEKIKAKIDNLKKLLAEYEKTKGTYKNIIREIIVFILTKGSQINENEIEAKVETIDLLDKLEEADEVVDRLNDIFDDIFSNITELSFAI